MSTLSYCCCCANNLCVCLMDHELCLFVNCNGRKTRKEQKKRKRRGSEHSVLISITISSLKLLSNPPLLMNPQSAVQLLSVTSLSCRPHEIVLLPLSAAESWASELFLTQRYLRTLEKVLARPTMPPQTKTATTTTIRTIIISREEENLQRNPPNVEVSPSGSPVAVTIKGEQQQQQRSSRRINEPTTSQPRAY